MSCFALLTRMDSKIFNDPIHGHIEIHPLCVRIVDTPQFQRLRYLKQLGACYFVFPGASHNRFEHSLGVCHLAGELVEALRSRQPDIDITNEDVLCVKIAGLCHDLGHGPFSHMFDSKFIPTVRPGYSWKHEDASVAMFEHMVAANNLRPHFAKFGLGDTDLEFIKEQIAGPKLDGVRQPEEWPYKGRELSKSFLYEIVANKRNGIDVDKWDYFGRDCHQLGIRSNFDHFRFLKFARVLLVNGQRQICCRDKEVGNLYDMFYTRNVLHRRAYQHKTTVIVEYMISEAMILANNHLLFPGQDGRMLKMSEAVDDMESYTQVNDSVFFRILYSTEPALAPAREILEKIGRRELYKFVGQTKPKPVSSVSPEDLKSQIQQTLSIVSVEHSLSPVKQSNAVPLQPDDIVVLVAKFDYGMQNKNPMDHMNFFSKSRPDLAVHIRKDQVSEMLPETFSEISFRVYCKRADSIAMASKCFPEVCDRLDLLPPKGGDPGAVEFTPVKDADVAARGRKSCSPVNCSPERLKRARQCLENQF